MRQRHAGALVGGAVVLFAASCQLVAGVRNDGELETDTTTSSTSAGGGTSSSTDASTSSASSSSSYMRPMCGGYPCDDTCVDGTFCVVASCTPGAIFDVFTPTELQNHKLADSLPSAVSNGHLVVGVVDTVTNELLVRAIDADAAMVTPIAPFLLGTAARFDQARFAGSNVAFQGRMNGEIGEVRFGYLLGDPAPHSPTFVSFGKPAVCTASEEVERVVFTLGELDEVSYAANCSDPGTSYKLVMGGESTLPKLVDSATLPDPTLKVDAYEFSKGYYLVLTGDGREGEQPHFRGGTSIPALATATPFRLSANPSANPARLLLTKQAAVPGDFLFLGLDLTIAPETTGTLWRGLFEDPASLGGALPLAAFEPRAELDATTTKASFGTPGGAFASGEGGLLATVIALDGTTLRLSLNSADGTLLAPFERVYESPDGTIRASTVGYDGITTLVAWIEETAGVSRVRAAPITCAALP